MTYLSRRKFLGGATACAGVLTGNQAVANPFTLDFSVVEPPAAITCSTNPEFCELVDDEGFDIANDIVRAPKWTPQPTVTSPRIQRTARVRTPTQSGTLSLYMRNLRSGKSIREVIWANNQWQVDKRDIDELLYDHYANVVGDMHPELILMLAKAQGLLETDEPFEVISGLRTPETNAKLRRRSAKNNNGVPQVAKNSYHIRRVAADMRHRRLRHLQKAMIAAGAHWTKAYGSSNFVHGDMRRYA